MNSILNPSKRISAVLSLILLLALVSVRSGLQAQDNTAGPTAGGDSTSDQAVGVEATEDGVVNTQESEGINIYIDYNIGFVNLNYISDL